MKKMDDDQSLLLRGRAVCMKKWCTAAAAAAAKVSAEFDYLRYGSIIPSILYTLCKKRFAVCASHAVSF